MLFLLATAVAPLAFAQQDLALCRGGFTNDDLRARLDATERALSGGELEVVRAQAKQSYEQLACLEAVVDRTALARLAWMLGFLANVDQDEPGAARWVRLARLATHGDPVVIPAYVPEGHPFRGLVEDEVAPSPTGEAGPRAPRGGGLFLDGMFLPLAVGFVDTPGFFQVADRDGRVVASTWAEGVALPEEYVGAPGAAHALPRWWTGDAIGVAPPLDDAAPTPPPTLPLGRAVATGGLAVLAGSTYALAALAGGAMDRAGTEPELARARTLTNTLAVSSAVVAASAVGVGVTVFLADGPGLHLSLRF